jgi:uncharacterized protein YecE (DUF72 family)
MATVRIGISGWRYAGWRGVFYPRGLAQHRELAYAARELASIEINGTFYSLQRPACFEAWHDETPEGFVFAVKGSRYITHMKRLADVEKPLANFFASGVFLLREKMGPFLWQLPPNFQFDPARLEAFFRLLPRDLESALALARRRDARLKGRACLRIDANRPLRHAIEIRHPSFVDRRFYRLLRTHDVGLVVADTAGKWPLIEEVTSDFVYVRLHGDTQLYVSGYSDAALERWAERVRRWGARRDVYVYFDNDAKVHAPFDARKLAQKLLLSAHGANVAEPGRVPRAHRLPRRAPAQPRHAA